MLPVDEHVHLDALDRQLVPHAYLVLRHMRYVTAFP